MLDGCEGVGCREGKNVKRRKRTRVEKVARPLLLAADGRHDSAHVELWVFWGSIQRDGRSRGEGRNGEMDGEGSEEKGNTGTRSACLYKQPKYHQCLARAVSADRE